MCQQKHAIRQYYEDCTQKEGKHCSPADLTRAINIYGKDWKFSPKCKSCATGQDGFFWVKPLGKNHVDGYGHYSVRIEKNRRVAEGNEKNKNK